MKKVLFILAVLGVIVISCSKQDLVEAEKTPIQENECLFQNDPLIVNLTNFNDSLMTSRPETRWKFWSFFKKVVKVAF